MSKHTTLEQLKLLAQRTKGRSERSNPSPW